ncbi:hypothetical protein OnM2_051072 [Erysiphe neolycopersici]|uniref:Uncharacterized protein n=1 Tax=Erysiphe neolycopersici TaxID=212602 RepID=A0A420HSL2_9PEZI|nr:hypothetical protein OnM2_051072 [Erysiphe neolycopersici]
MSPDLSRAFRKLSTRVSKRTSKSQSKVRTENLSEREALFVEESEYLSMKRNKLKGMVPLLSADHRAFRIPVVVR